MNTKEIKTLLGWCFIINFILLIFSSISILVFLDEFYKIHSNFFTLSIETYNALLFAYMALWKVLNIVFFGVPYIALWIVEKKVNNKKKT